MPGDDEVFDIREIFLHETAEPTPFKYSVFFAHWACEVFCPLSLCARTSAGRSVRIAAQSPREVLLRWVVPLAFAAGLVFSACAVTQGGMGWSLERLP